MYEELEKIGFYQARLKRTWVKPLSDIANQHLGENCEIRWESLASGILGTSYSDLSGQRIIELDMGLKLWQVSRVFFHELSHHFETHCN